MYLTAPTLMEIEPMKTVDQVILLIAKAAESHDSNDALKFSQAACNAANALCSLQNAQAMNAAQMTKDFK